MKSLVKKSLNTIRKKWLQIFTQNHYFLIDSSSLIPKDDPSLLWINSGVAALKKYFNNPQLAPARNLVNCQRVIRTNDIDRINSNSYHQTLFEMLGSFSIGGNFKTEIIPLIWRFFTSKKYLGLEPRCLFITVLESDKETFQVWKKQPQFPEENIIFGSRETNFWDMGDGPCGPNSEVFYSFKGKQNIRPTNIDELDKKDFIEIINIVFSEFYHDKENYLPLPEKCVDVGAGLERIALVLQTVKSTFETDIWTNSVDWLRKCSESKGTFFVGEEWRIYVIVDHLRTFMFAIADGALISHKQRGYILKKLIKRSSLFGYMLGIKREELLLASEMIITDNSDFYQFLLLRKSYILASLDKELLRFLRSFEVSNQNLEEYLKDYSEQIVPAEKVFFWYDTKGIPIELIVLSLSKKGKTFDREIFDNFLSKQRERSFFHQPKVNIFDS